MARTFLHCTGFNACFVDTVQPQKVILIEEYS